jgi:signal transduction histidine kinase
LESESEGSTYRTIFEWLPLPALLLDHELRITLANRATAEMFEVPSEKLPGRPLLSIVPYRKLSRFLRNFGDTRSKVLELEMPACAGRTGMTLRITAVRLASEDLPLKPQRPAVVPKPILESKLLLFENITDKVFLEQQLVKFVRENLTDSFKPEALEALDTTIERLGELRQLLFTLTGFVRRKQPKYELTDLHELIRRSVAFIARDAESRGVQLTVSLAPVALACELDYRTINQVLLNLLKNAIESMPTGGRLEVRTQLRPADNDDQEGALVEVSDTGIGIEDAELRKIFRPLYSAKSPGMGLGLSFCRQVIEEHGGKIHLSSRRGAGTTVAIILPLRQEETNA